MLHSPGPAYHSKPEHNHNEAIPAYWDISGP